MSHEDAQQILDGLKEFVQEATSSEQKAREALLQAGLIKADGQPAEQYEA